MGSSMIVAGATNSGKTEFILAVLKNMQEMFNIQPSGVYWFYGEVTRRQNYLKEAGFHLREGLPENFDHVPKKSIIVLDDLMDESKDAPQVTALFTKRAHHRSFFVIVTMQNLFNQSKESRDRALNVQYLVLFKNPRDGGQITTLNSQMFRRRKGYLEACFENATKDSPNSYLFLDLHQHSSEQTRVRTRVLKRERPMMTYIHI